MKLKDFIRQFSHNNQVYVENRDNYCMYYKYNPGDLVIDSTIMDWELPYTDLADCEIKCISNVIHTHGDQAITFVVDTDKKEFSFIPELVTEKSSPLWLYERVHKTKVEMRGDAVNRM